MGDVDAPLPTPGADVLFSGVVIGVVTSLADPLQRGRVMVRFATPSGVVADVWAPVMTALAGPDPRPQALPEEGATVVLAFEHGDGNLPVVLGRLAPDEQEPHEGGGPARLRRGRPRR